MESYYYLSSPYNGNATEKAYRYGMCCQAVSVFIKNGINLVSPLVYNETIIKAFDGLSLEERRNLILPVNIAMLKPACGLILFKLPGWEDSWGVQREIEEARKLGLPIYSMLPEHLAGDITSIVKNTVDLAEIKLKKSA